MIPPPPAGDTWGVPGPAFLIGYLLLAAAVVLLSVLARRRLFAGPGAPAHHQLHPQQAAHRTAVPGWRCTPRWAAYGPPT